MARSENGSTSSSTLAGRTLETVCLGLAMVGGLLLIGVALLTVVSVLGRYFVNSPITGDFELVEMGCAFAVSLFLPYCQLRRGNVIVDVLTMGLPARAKCVLDAVGCLLVALVAALFTWRTAVGGWEFARYNDQTMVLHIPTWWGFVPLVPSMGLLCVVGLVTARRALRGIDDVAIVEGYE